MSSVTKILKTLHDTIQQLVYDDPAGIGPTFNDIEECFERQNLWTEFFVYTIPPCLSWKYEYVSPGLFHAVSYICQPQGGLCRHHYFVCIDDYAFPAKKVVTRDTVELIQPSKCPKFDISKGWPINTCVTFDCP